MGRRRTVWQSWEGIFIDGIFHLINRIVLSLASNLHVFRTVLICRIFAALSVLFCRKLFSLSIQPPSQCDRYQNE